MVLKRPDILEGKTIKVKTGCGALYLTLNHDDGGKLFEVRLSLGKTGTCQNSFLYNVGIMYSVLIQSGVPYDKIVRTLRKHTLGSKCDNPFQIGDKMYGSCLDIVAEKIIEEIEKDKGKH